MRFLALVGSSCLAAAAPAAAEVVSASNNGFELRFVKQVSGDPAAAMQRFSHIGRWWSAEHTYSGQASNLSLELEPGGCFCERLPGGGGVEHLRVSVVVPGEKLVLSGGLGPLLYEGTAGVMDVSFKPASGGSEVSLVYRAAGFATGGAGKLAPLVDKVLSEQLDRYAAFAD